VKIADVRDTTRDTAFRGAHTWSRTPIEVTRQAFPPETRRHLLPLASLRNVSDGSLLAGHLLGGTLLIFGNGAFQGYLFISIVA
jgi:hypothetical protein